MLSVSHKSLCIAELWSEILAEMQLELNVYNSRIETDSGLHALPVTQNEQYFNFLVNFLNEHKFSSLVMGVTWITGRVLG